MLIELRHWTVFRITRSDREETALRVFLRRMSIEVAEAADCGDCTRFLRWYLDGVGWVHAVRVELDRVRDEAVEKLLANDLFDDFERYLSTVKES